MVAICECEQAARLLVARAGGGGSAQGSVGQSAQDDHGVVATLSVRHWRLAHSMPQFAAYRQARSHRSATATAVGVRHAWGALVVVVAAVVCCVVAQLP